MTQPSSTVASLRALSPAARTRLRAAAAVAVWLIAGGVAHVITRDAAASGPARVVASSSRATP